MQRDRQSNGDKKEEKRSKAMKKQEMPIDASQKQKYLGFFRTSAIDIY